MKWTARAKALVDGLAALKASDVRQHVAAQVQALAEKKLEVSSRTRTMRSIERSRQRPPDTRDARIAVHETGHLVVMWACTKVLAVHCVSIEKGTTRTGTLADGHVDANLDEDMRRTDSGQWCNLVNILGGAAAEAYIYGSIVGQAHDVMQAHEVAEHLAEKKFKAPTVKWAGAAITLPMRAGSDAGVALVKDAFVAAWALIADYGYRFDRTVQLLLTRRVLTESDIEATLGPRWIPLAAGLLTSTFVITPWSESNEAHWRAAQAMVRR